MKAVVMVGGKGTRLRPLTCDIPKPMVPVVNKPMMEHVVRLLKTHGFDDLLITVCYLPEAIEEYFGDGSRFGVRMRYFREDKPLGTAGSVKNVEEFLDGTFLVIAGDVLTDIDLSAAVAHHKAVGSMATLVLTRVNNPLEYGVVITGVDGKIQRFLEKPSWGEVFSDTVNTCIYVLEPESLKYFNKNQVFDFSKDLFPVLLRNGDPLYGHIGEGYWSDIGNLEQYRQSHYDILEGKVSVDIPGQRVGESIWIGAGCEISRDAVIEGPTIIGNYCKIGAGVTMGGYSIIGDRNVIHDRSSIKRSIVWNSSYIGSQSELRATTVCNKVTIKTNSSLYEGSVIGCGSIIGEGAKIKPQVKIWPSKTVEAGVVLSDSLVWSSKSSKRLFGTMGVSGIINVEATPEFIAKLGSAYGSMLNPGEQVVVSNDSHKPSRMAKRALIAGLMSSGVNTYDLGTLTTPATRYSIRTLGVKGGIHVRISPYDQRVLLIEFMDDKGLNLDKGTERKVENAYFSEDFTRADPNRIGELAFLPRLVDSYLDGLLNTVDVASIRKIGLKIVVDYDPGNLSVLLPSLLDNFGCSVIASSVVSDDGHAPRTYNESIDAAYALAERVKAESADLGIVVDENAERLILVDEKGNVINDETFMALMSLIGIRVSPNRTISVPVTAPVAIEKLAEQYSGTVIRTQTNPRAQMENAIKEKLLAPGTNSSGASGYNTVMDALVSLARVLELMADEKKTLSQVIQSLPEFHMVRQSVPCPWDAKGKVMRGLIEENLGHERLELIDGVKVYHDQGWALVLPDSDQPLFHVVSEASTDEEADVLRKLYMDKITSLQNYEEAPSPTLTLQ